MVVTTVCNLLRANGNIKRKKKKSNPNYHGSKYFANITPKKPTGRYGK